ncbi:hypothetical protein BDQ12DRAFT_666817 [Crucibulum laeve]|uniref:Uncharacterized protein n=1 Tax=Crucibulum laeve TaxID=68775 RepID=A0A5C3M8S8_9AGAR|nr:hypothetical protein BDQ12DRAFT_666817 [Crucibulum laeve]
MKTDEEEHDEKTRKGGSMDCNKANDVNRRKNLNTLRYTRQQRSNGQFTPLSAPIRNNARRKLTAGGLLGSVAGYTPAIGWSLGTGKGLKVVGTMGMVEAVVVAGGWEGNAADPEGAEERMVDAEATEEAEAEPEGRAAEDALEGEADPEDKTVEEAEEAAEAVEKTVDAEGMAEETTDVAEDAAEESVDETTTEDGAAGMLTLGMPEPLGLCAATRGRRARRARKRIGSIMLVVVKGIVAVLWS